MSEHELKNKTNREIDLILGIEKHQLKSDEQKYDPKIFYTDGLTSADALYTDYQDLLSIYEELCARDIKSFCDLGAGVGRAKLLFDFLNSPFKNYSIEYVQERHQEGLRAHQKLDLSFPEGFINADLSQQPPPLCDCYFIYLPVNDILIQTLSFIEELYLYKGKSCYIMAIESHGDLLSFLETTHPYLKRIKTIPLKSKRHKDELVLFEWRASSDYLDNKSHLHEKIATHKEKLKVTFNSNQDFWMLWKLLKNEGYFQLLIEDQNGQWLADLKNSNFGIQPNTIETLFPYRIISLNEIQAIVKPPSSWNSVIDERRLAKRGPLGEMRKLFVSPFPQVEYSWGQKKELEKAWKWELFSTLKV